MDGDQEIQQGYLPNLRGPVGTKLRREATEKPTLVMQWLSEAGQTTMRQIATKWGVPAEATGPFLERLFAFLVERALLVPVRLKGARGGPLPNVSGVYQVNADRLLLSPNRSVWRCRSCRRATTRETPHDRCPAWRCDGILEWVREDEDNYDLQLLDGAYSMLRSEEHTAMVPTDERERLENLFKGASEAVNCLVCTPTLELGIDIGRLDSLLMRNVPPLPANYRQRAGRPDAERDAIRNVLHRCLPRQVEPYLFEDGEVRRSPFDFSALRDLVWRHAVDLAARVERVFQQGWPDADAGVTHSAALRAHVDDFTENLELVVARLERRLRWAMRQITRLNARREVQGTLDPDDEALFRRRDRLVKRLKGTDRRSRRQAEGHDDVNTFSVLAAEGFLPGYGLEVGSVVGWAEIPFWRSGAMDFSLPRAPATALREYVPGNLIYANGHRFVARRFHRDLHGAPGAESRTSGGDQAEMPVYEVSVERQAVRQTRRGEVADTCPGLCESSCIDCLQTFRNAYYHGQLNRAAARERIDEWGRRLSFDHEIPRQQPEGPSAEHAAPVNDAEVKLRHLLLAAGFGEGIRGEQIQLDRALGTTTPDVIYRAENDDPDESVCIYLDGLSEHLHGNRETAEKDREIRTWLRNRGYEVVEIGANELDDEDAMVGHFRRLASYLSLPDVRRRVREDRSWFRNPAAPGTARRPRLRLVMPQADARHVDCVPLVPLEVAAGAFGDPHTVPDESEWDWVEIETTRSLRRGMFVAHVVGQSMEPAVPDGSYCLFASPVTGARQGRTVLVQLHDTVDPDTGDRFTVKRYRSEKTTNEDGWRHVKIVLDPVNPDFEPIELTMDDEESVTVVAELVEVIGPEPPAGEPAES